MMMVILFLIALVMFPFVFPEEFLYWSAKIRQWLAIQQRKRQQAWEEQLRAEEAATAALKQALHEKRREMRAIKRKLARLAKQSSADTASQPEAAAGTTS
jgi:hypothetical protein